VRAWTLVAVVLSGVFALAGCSLVPTSALEARDADQKFELLLRVGSARYAANAPIEASATLSYLGPNAGIDIVGSGSGVVTYSVRQIDGRLEIGGAQTDDCKPYRLDRGRPMVVPYAKSGGWAGDDEDAAFYVAFFNDPVFRLPPGTWMISANAGFTEEECGGVAHALSSHVTIAVE
jgi:hypothetical protein